MYELAQIRKSVGINSRQVTKPAFEAHIALHPGRSSKMLNGCNGFNILFFWKRKKL